MSHPDTCQKPAAPNRLLELVEAIQSLRFPRKHNGREGETAWGLACEGSAQRNARGASQVKHLLECQA